MTKIFCTWKVWVVVWPGVLGKASNSSCCVPARKEASINLFEIYPEICSNCYFSPISSLGSTSVFILTLCDACSWKSVVRLIWVIIVNVWLSNINISGFLAFHAQISSSSAHPADHRPADSARTTGVGWPRRHLFVCRNHIYYSNGLSESASKYTGNIIQIFKWA
jgi:hypothetical protein